MIQSPFPRISADDYERYRPGYPPDAIDWLIRQGDLVPGSRILDLAAGTGQLSRPMLAAGMRVVAMEPASNMRRKLHEVVPDALVVAGVAEAIPTRDGSFDAVVVGQAVHWFDGHRSLLEIHRALRPGRALAILWIRHDHEAVASVHLAMDEVVDPFLDPDSPVDQALDHWDAAFAEGDLFGPFQTARFLTTQRLRAADLAPALATSSDVAFLPQDRRDSLLQAVRSWAVTLPREVELPMIAEFNLAVRI